MEPEIATAMIRKHLAIAHKLQSEVTYDLDDKSLLICFLINAASLAHETGLEGYDFLQLADAAYQILGLPLQGEPA